MARRAELAGWKAPPRSAFLAPTPDVARGLLGWVLAHETRAGLVAGRIVETEAYLGLADPAAHSYRGETARCASMFGAPGHAYVYLSYGMHRCFNVVTQRAGIGEAVLVRALEPLVGLDVMRARRGVERARDLASGPGKLCQALGIELEDDGADLLRSRLRLLVPPASAPSAIEVAVGPRIGITRAADLALRFVVRGSPWASRSA
jgi:DNA-3-methyladenine glycosylase